jgi:hypothetical protein
MVISREEALRVRLVIFLTEGLFTISAEESELNG